MQLTLTDFGAILEIILVLFASSFALLLPLYAYLNNIHTALKISIPLSFCVEIIFGYLFYIFGIIKYFPLVYFLIILLANFIIAYRLKLFRGVKNLRFSLSWKTVIPIFLVIAAVVSFRFFDAVKNIAPGAIDAAAHALYILDLRLVGKLSFASYPPGFHILVFPISQVTHIIDVYRFTGPSLGIMTILSLYLLFKDFFKSKLSALFLVLAFGLPVFNILTLQTISFFPTALTFVFLPILAYLLTKPKELPVGTNLLFFALTISGLALTVPYLFVQFVPVILILSIVSLASLNIKYFSFIWKTLVISLLGFILAFGLVYLQNTISDRTDVGNFPQITIAEGQGSGFTVTTNIQESNVFLDHRPALKNIIGSSKVINDYFIPMVMTGKDVIALKDIRPLSGIVSIVAYLWIAISLTMIYFGARKKDFVLFTLGTLILMFGAATQTGIFEMSTYRGRSGWYLLLFVLAGAIYVLDRYIKKMPRSMAFAIIVLLLIVPLINPPTFYRGYFSEYFTQALAISRQFPNQKILLITNERKVISVSEHFTYHALEPSLANGVCQYDQCFIMLENKFFAIDPILSQRSLAIDKGLKDFSARQAALKKEHDELNDEIKKSENFAKYKLYWQNDNLSVYRFDK